MKKCLIAYTSKHGQTEKIAKYIHEELSDYKWKMNLLNLNDLNVTVDFSKYDILVFGASIHGGRFSKKFNKFLKENHRFIDEKKSHIFVVSLASAIFDHEERLTSEEDIHRIIHRLPVKFNTHQLFAGALMYTKYSWLIRFIMKSISKRQNGATNTSKDHEYTNWNRVHSYVHFLTTQNKKSLRLISKS